MFPVDKGRWKAVGLKIPIMLVFMLVRFRKFRELLVLNMYAEK
jgi:hypothetical protein